MRRPRSLWIALLSSSAVTMLSGVAGVLAQDVDDAVTERVKHAVVLIETFDEFGYPLKIGSGFFINNAGHIVTNVHVLNGAYVAVVTTYKGEHLRFSSVIEADDQADILIGRVETARLDDPYDGEEYYLARVPSFAIGNGGLVHTHLVKMFATTSARLREKPNNYGPCLLRGPQYRILLTAGLRPVSKRDSLPSFGPLNLFSDLSVCRALGYVEPVESPHFLRLATRMPKVGDSVLLVGHPLGYEYTDSQGTIKGIRDASTYDPTLRYGEVIQFDAHMSGGNSGGPLVNEEGDVVAVATYNYPGGQALNFGISLRTLKRILSIANESSTNSLDLWNRYPDAISLRNGVDLPCGWQAEAAKSFDLAAALSEMTIRLYPDSWNPQTEHPDYFGFHLKSALCMEEEARREPDRARLLTEKAFSKISDFAKVHPEDYRPFYQLGLRHAASGRFSQAAEMFERTTVLMPGHVDAMLQLGLCRVKLGERAPAIEILKALRTLDPVRFKLLYDLVYPPGD